jgi:hypothetical protein
MSRKRVLIGVALIVVAELFGTWIAGWWRWRNVASCWNPVATVLRSANPADRRDGRTQSTVLIRNDGWGRLRINRMIPTEGRTKVTYKPADVPTGQSIEVNIDQAMLPGDRSTRLVVETNDPANRILVIDPFRM